PRPGRKAWNGRQKPAVIASGTTKGRVGTFHSAVGKTRRPAKRRRKSRQAGKSGQARRAQTSPRRKAKPSRSGQADWAGTKIDTAATSSPQAQASQPSIFALRIAPIALSPPPYSKGRRLFRKQVNGRTHRPCAESCPCPS